MSSREAGSDVRNLLLRRDVLALAMAVVVGTALFQVVYAVVEYLAMPVARGLFRKQGTSSPDLFSNPPLYATFHGYVLVWGEVASLAITLTLAILLVLFLWRRVAFARLEDQDWFEPDFEADSDFRPCPECLSQIPITARRCAFCTAVVEREGCEPQG